MSHFSLRSMSNLDLNSIYSWSHKAPSSSFAKLKRKKYIHADQIFPKCQILLSCGWNQIVVSLCLIYFSLCVVVPSAFPPHFRLGKIWARIWNSLITWHANVSRIIKCKNWKGPWRSFIPILSSVGICYYTFLIFDHPATI